MASLKQIFSGISGLKCLLCPIVFFYIGTVFSQTFTEINKINLTFLWKSLNTQIYHLSSTKLFALC